MDDRRITRLACGSSVTTRVRRPGWLIRAQILQYAVRKRMRGRYAPRYGHTVLGAFVRKSVMGTSSAAAICCKVLTLGEVLPFSIRLKY